MIKFDMLFFLLIYQSYAINTLIKYNERFCSQFVNCENCAGRHHDSEFTECVWCPIFNSCISTNSKCRSGYWEKIDCPLLSVTEYNETFARVVGTPLIAAAQGTLLQMQSCIATLPANIELSKRFAIQTSLGERTDGYVAVDHSHQAIIASFSSVAAGKKLFYRHFNAEFFTNRQAQFEGTDGLVNRFVYDSWYKLWYVMGMEKTIRTLIANYTTFEIWFFGHSIGGAKAEMSVLSILFKKLVAQQKVRLLTFGSSRVGDVSFAQLIEDLVPYRFRIVHGRDMVPHYPRKFDGEWTPPHHHRYEVWYPNGMRPGDKYIVCLGAEDPQCSSRLSPWEIRAAENDLYFERSMQHWVESFCADKVTYTNAHSTIQATMQGSLSTNSTPNITSLRKKYRITANPLLFRRSHQNSSYRFGNTDIIKISSQSPTPFKNHTTLNNSNRPRNSSTTTSSTFGIPLIPTSTVEVLVNQSIIEAFVNDTSEETAISNMSKGLENYVSTNDTIFS